MNGYESEDAASGILDQLSELVENATGRVFWIGAVHVEPVEILERSAFHERITGSYLHVPVLQ